MSFSKSNKKEEVGERGRRDLLIPRENTGKKPYRRNLTTI